MVHLSLQKLPSAKSNSVKVLLFALLITLQNVASAETQGVKTILVLGDSLSAGYGIDADKGWVNLMRHRLDDKPQSYEVVNASISGETTAGGLRRLPQLLEKYQPQVVLLELGGNDGLRGFPLSRMRSNLQKMIELCQHQEALPVLFGMQIPPNYGQRYSRQFAQTYPSLAENYDVPLVPFFMDGVATNPAMMQGDGIHPNESGQAPLLENAWPAVMPLL